MNTTLRAQSPRPGLAVTPPSAHPLGGADLPADYDYSRDYFPAAPIDFILLDAHLLFTRPPAGAETLADVVQRIAGGTLRAERARPALAVTPGGVTPSPGADLPDDFVREVAE